MQTHGPVFARRSIVLMIGIGGIAFMAMMAILIHGSGRVSGPRAGSNAYSISAIGHVAFVRLLEAAGTPVLISRDDTAARAGVESLVIAAEPRDRETAASVSRALMAADTTLLVLPKRRGTPDWVDPDWIRRVELIDVSIVQQVLREFASEAQIQRVGEPVSWTVNRLAAQPTLDQPQLMRSGRLTPIVGGKDGILLGELRERGRRLWILSDPDVIANHGIGHGSNAAFALEMVNALRPADGSVVFDAAMHGFERTASLGRAVFSPPLLPATIQVGVMAGLLAWAAAVRFGRPLPPPPAFAPGTTTLVGIGARLLRSRQHMAFVLTSYFAAAVQSVTRGLHLRPANERDLTDRLDRIGEARGTRHRYSALRYRLAALARSGTATWAEALAAARDVYRWRRDMTDGS